VEQELREAMLTGRPVDWRTGDSKADDPAHGAGWDAQRTIPATLLAELLTNTEGPRRPRALRLAGARIIGQLDLEAAELVCELLLGGCWFAEPVILDQAQALSLQLPASQLPGLSADRLATRGSLQLGSGFAATGEIRLRGAHIDGQLDLGGATLTNPSGSALDAEALTVDDSMSCLEGIIRGEVNLRSAHIGGQLDLGGATLTNPDGYALAADGLTVDMNMFCGDGFAATGEVSLLGAHIGGQLEFRGATLTNPDRHALSADELTVDHSMHCTDGFTARGMLNLVGAHIGGQLAFDGATLTNPNGPALQLQDLRAGALFLRDLTEPPALVEFTHAQVAALNDEPASWPRQAILDGFVYDALVERKPISARQRLDWLTRNPRGYSPQPYEQLAAVYRRAGRDQDARTVAIAKQRARRRTLGLAGRLWSLLLDGLVGYGYRTWLAGVWLAAFWLIGWVVFDRAHEHHQLVLAKPGEAHPSFHGAVYSLDTLLPVVDLHQQAVWIPDGWVQWWAWASILAGWVLTTAVVAALTGLLKRD
jgi:adhesin HecA-like repeat protein